MPQLNRKTTTIAAMFLAPVLTVQLALPLHRFMGKPQAASATPVDVAMPEVVVAPPKPTELQIAATAHMDSLRGVANDLESPFYYAPKVIEQHHEDPIVIARDTPQFRITSILEARDGQVLAMLNGKMCAVGASPVEGWTITAIDANTKTVTVISDEGGEELVLQFGRQATGGNS